MEVTIRLTEEQAKNLVAILQSVDDAGPMEAGWQSDELIELGDVVSQQVKHQLDT